MANETTNKMTGYLSDKTLIGQKEYLNDCIKKINNNIDNGTIEVKGRDKADENERALTTDTHGDLISLMGAAAMCGVKFKENEFLYYDRNEGIYYEKVNGKYYKYTPPYTRPKKEGKGKDSIEIEGKNNIIVVPIPDISNARVLYHLGDVIDRGQESLTSLLFCEICPTIKLAQGNHEFDRVINNNYGYKPEIDSIEIALARMKHNGKINTGYYDGKGDDVISYSHIPLTEDHVEGFFNFLNSAYMTVKYSNEEYLNENPPVVKFLDKEFKKQEGHEDLCKKVKDFLGKGKTLNFETIKENFTKEEMLIIKNVVAGALIERQFKVAEDGKITFVNGGFYSYMDFDELLLNDPEGRNVNIINFEDSEGREDIEIVCNGVAGHERGNGIRNGKNGVLYADDSKSAGYRTEGSCATVTNINIETGEISHSSFSVEREEKGEIFLGKIKPRKNNNLKEGTFRQNIKGYKSNDEGLDSFKLPYIMLENNDKTIIDEVKKNYKTSNIENIKSYAENHYITNNFIQENYNESEVLTNNKLKCYLTTIKLGDIESVNNYMEELEKFFEILNESDKLKNFGETKEEFIKKHLEAIKKYCIEKAINKEYSEEVINKFKKLEKDLDPKKEEPEINEENLYNKTNNWINFDWFYRGNEDGDEVPEKETKIYIAIDPEPENILKSKIVFRKFMDKHNLYGKMPLKNSKRSALIIYGPVTKEQLIELEEKMQEAGVRPKLFKSGKSLGDIAIKGSLYSYFKCDGFEYIPEIHGDNRPVYDNPKQVEYMDRIRKGEFMDIEIIRRYKDMDLSNDVHRDYTKYNESEKYTEYLKMILPCNAVQRQILDVFFRLELMENNPKMNIINFISEFIPDNKEIVEAFAENIKKVPKNMLIDYLNENSEINWDDFVSKFMPDNKEIGEAFSEIFTKNKKKFPNNKFINILNKEPKINWTDFTPDFITDRLEFVKTIIENTKRVPEVELRSFLNTFIKGGTVSTDPTITEKCKEFIKSVKDNIENKEYIKNIFESEYRDLGISFEEIEKDLENDDIDIDEDDDIEEEQEKEGDNALEKIGNYFKEGGLEGVVGFTELQHLLYLLDDIYNYNRENKKLDDKGNIILDGKIDTEFMNLYNSLKEKYDDLIQKNIKVLKEAKTPFLYYKEEQEIFGKIIKESPVQDIINRHKYVIANRTSEREYEKFSRRYSKTLETYELNHKGSKEKIKNCLDILFSYDKSLKEKIDAQKELKKILYNIKKEYKESHGKTIEAFGKTKSFLGWPGICNATKKELEKTIDLYRERYLKTNNMKYFKKDAQRSAMVKTTLKTPMALLRGVSKPEDMEDEKYLQLLDNWCKNGMDSNNIYFVTKNNNKYIGNNTVHQGMLSTTTDLNTTKKYGKFSEDGVIFLISPNVGTEVLNPVLGDNRASYYAQMDFDTIPAESIVGYFKRDNDGKYIFHKNENFKNQDLDNNYEFVNKDNEKKQLENSEKYTDDDINSIIKDSELKRNQIQKEYLMKAVEIAKYLVNKKEEKDKDEKEDVLYNEVMGLFPEGDKNKVVEYLKNISVIGEKEIDYIIGIRIKIKENKKDFSFREINYGTDYDNLTNFYEKFFIKTRRNTTYFMANIYNYLEVNNKLKYIDGIEIEDADIGPDDIESSAGKSEKDNIQELDRIRNILVNYEGERNVFLESKELREKYKLTNIKNSFLVNKAYFKYLEDTIGNEIAEMFDFYNYSKEFSDTLEEEIKLDVGPKEYEIYNNDIVDNKNKEKYSYSEHLRLEAYKNLIPKIFDKAKEDIKNKKYNNIAEALDNAIITIKGELEEQNNVKKTKEEEREFLENRIAALNKVIKEKSENSIELSDKFGEAIKANQMQKWNEEFDEGNIDIDKEIQISQLPESEPTNNIHKEAKRKKPKRLPLSPFRPKITPVVYDDEKIENKEDNIKELDRIKNILENYEDGYNTFLENKELRKRYKIADINIAYCKYLEDTIGNEIAEMLDFYNYSDNFSDALEEEIKLDVGSKEYEIYNNDIINNNIVDNKNKEKYSYSEHLKLEAYKNLIPKIFDRAKEDIENEKYNNITEALDNAIITIKGELEEQNNVKKTKEEEREFLENRIAALNKVIKEKSENSIELSDKFGEAIKANQMQKWNEEFDQDNINIMNIFLKAFDDKKFGDIRNLLNFCVDKICSTTYSKEFIEDFFKIFNTVCSNRREEFSEISENFIDDIAKLDNGRISIISNLVFMTPPYKNYILADKLLNNNDLKNKIIENENIDINYLIIHTLKEKNIYMANVLIKHSFKFNIEKVKEADKKFLEIARESIKNLAEAYKIDEEKFNEITSRKNKETNIKEEFEKLNDVLKLIEEKINNPDKNVQGI